MGLRSYSEIRNKKFQIQGGLRPSLNLSGGGRMTPLFPPLEICHFRLTVKIQLIPLKCVSRCTRMYEMILYDVGKKLKIRCYRASLFILFKYFLNKNSASLEFLAKSHFLHNYDNINQRYTVL